MLKDFFGTLTFFFAGTASPVKEGHALISISFIITATGLLTAFFFNFRALFWLGILLTAFCFYFFRDPMRDYEFSPDEIVCPADGHVLSIKTEKDPNILVVRIFLSVFDVHIQRATIAGEVGQQVYHKGSFAFANADSAADNERNLIPLAADGRFANVEQITGAIARRIVSWVKDGQRVRAGEKIGMIYFGSQVAVYLPAGSVRVLVRPGQKVQGGITVLGLFK
ncbi:MAG: phosphatidylserine decarboxylase [Elusimicrobiaceae bacterium]|jgi:phosphatidylserine decarboxylase